MDDARGGWKAADTALWREHLHAATMVGRVAAAQQAVELGYGIVADPGPSGRLGHRAIDGAPPEVIEAHSKRAAETPPSSSAPAMTPSVPATWPPAPPAIPSATSRPVS